MINNLTKGSRGRSISLALLNLAVMQQKERWRHKKLRKQYHFRPSNNGLYAWDVDRLIKLTEDLERKLIHIDSIKELDDNFWFGADGDNPTCRAIAEHAKLIQETDLSYPIILCSRGKVMDGMHRVCKAYLEGRNIIQVVQFVIDPEPDYEDVHSPDDLPYY